MSGLFEARLEAIAKGPRYTDQHIYAPIQAALTVSANAWKNAAADPGFTGRAGDAASESFSTRASKTLTYADALERMGGQISALNGTLDEAWNIIDALPSTGAAERAFDSALTSMKSHAGARSLKIAEGVQQARAELAAAQTAREQAARAGYLKTVESVTYSEQAIYRVLEALGFTPTKVNSSAHMPVLTLVEILNRYQIADDPRGGGKPSQWDPYYYFPHESISLLFALAGRRFNNPMTAREKDMLNRMLPWELFNAYEAQRDAQQSSQTNYPTENGGAGNYDKNDAFRHAYWSALLAKRFGPDWAGQFTSAHEGYFSNPGPAEAMDLHNNEVGRSIAISNPDATDEELASLIKDAVERGNLTTIGADNQLQWSNSGDNHPEVSSFNEETGRDSLPGRDRKDFEVNDFKWFWE